MRPLNVLWITASLPACVVCDAKANQTAPGLVAQNAPDKASPLLPEGHWTYEALRYLKAAGFLPLPASEETRLLTRREMGLMTAFLISAWQENKTATPSFPNTSQLSQQVMSNEERLDLLRALEREFAEEAFVEKPLSLQITPERGTFNSRSRTKVPSLFYHPKSGSPPFTKLEKQLKTLLQNHQPAVETSQPFNLLVVESNVRNFAVYGLGGDGSFDQQLRTQRGPNSKGFRLTVLAVNGRYDGASIPGHTHHNPYWKTYTDAFPTHGLSIPFHPGYTVPSPNQSPNSSTTNENRTPPRWAFKAMEQLDEVGYVERLPQEGADHKRTWTRYNFAVAIARVLQRVPDLRVEDYRSSFDTLRIATRSRLKTEVHWASLKALLREFALEMAKLGVNVPSLPNKSIHVEGSPSQHLWVELSFGAQTDAALIENIKQTVRDFADENYQTTLQSLTRTEKKP